MQIILDPEDIEKFLQFLHQKDKLKHFFSEIQVPSNLTMDYFKHLEKEKTQIPPLSVHSPKEEQPEEQVQEQTKAKLEEPLKKYANGSKPWSTYQLATLRRLIRQDHPLEHISDVLERSIPAVRKKAYDEEKFKYNNKAWIYIGK